MISLSRHGLGLAALVVILLALGVRGTSEAAQPSGAGDLIHATVRILLHQRHQPISLGQGEHRAPQRSESGVELYVQTPEGYHSITLTPNRLTEAINYTGLSDFYIYQQIAKGDGDYDYIPVMSASLAGHGREVYLLAHRQHRDEGIVRMIPLPVDPQGLASGNILAANLSPRSLRIATEQQRLQIDGFGTAVIDVSNTEPMRFQVMAAITEDDNFQLVYRRVWPVLTSSRGVVLFFPTDDKMTRWNSSYLRIE